MSNSEEYNIFNNRDIYDVISKHLSDENYINLSSCNKTLRRFFRENETRRKNINIPQIFNYVEPNNVNTYVGKYIHISNYSCPIVFSNIHNQVRRVNCMFNMLNDYRNISDYLIEVVIIFTENDYHSSGYCSEPDSCWDNGNERLAFLDFMKNQMNDIKHIYFIGWDIDFDYNVWKCTFKKVLQRQKIDFFYYSH